MGDVGVFQVLARFDVELQTEFVCNLLVLVEVSCYDEILLAVTCSGVYKEF
jgi:hypothetical protein